MKSSNLWRIIWIVGIYALLGLILYLVITYKVKWEHKDLNTYLYFYDCGSELCTSTTAQNGYYSKVLCQDDICPYIEDINGENLVLNWNDTLYLYNYVNDEKIGSQYYSYRYIGNDMYVVSDETGNYGIIDKNGEILVSLKYNYIANYDNGFISYIKDYSYGIMSIDDVYNIEPRYEDVVLINDKIFAGRKDNVYHLYSYDNPYNDNANKYDFVYAYDDVLFVVNNKKIDILDANLNSTLLLKINTFYEYTTEKERESLQFFVNDGYIIFKVFINENEYTNYIYSIKNKKLL